MNVLDDDQSNGFLHPDEVEPILVDSGIDVVDDDDAIIYVDDVNNILLPEEAYHTWHKENATFQDVQSDERQVRFRSCLDVEDPVFEDTGFEITSGIDAISADHTFSNPVLQMNTAVHRTPSVQCEGVEYEEDGILPLQNNTMVDIDDVPQFGQVNRGRRKAATIVTCEVCGVLLKHPSKIEAHMRTHTGEKPFECDLCGMKFSQRTPMLNHVRRHLGQTPYDCGYGCGKKFVNNAQKNAHELRHLGSKRAGPPRPHLKPPKRSLWNPVFSKCDPRIHVYEEERSAIVDFEPPVGHIEPPISVAASKRLDEIIDSVVSGVPIKKRTSRPSRPPMLVQCQICGLMLKHASKIRAHIRTHTGDKPYICVYCDEQFGTSGTLSMHIKRKHTSGERPYACTWDCGKRFVSLSTRNEHERIVHAGTKRYECSVAGCFRMFSRRYYLMLHRQREHGLYFKPIYDPEEISKAEREADREFLAEQQQEGVNYDYRQSDRIIVDPSTNMLIQVSDDGMSLEPNVDEVALIQGDFDDESSEEILLESVSESVLDSNPTIPSTDPSDSPSIQYVPSDIAMDGGQSCSTDIPLIECAIVNRDAEDRSPVRIHGNDVDVGDKSKALSRTRVVNILKKRPIRPSILVQRL